MISIENINSMRNKERRIKMSQRFVHPYMPNSVPDIEREILDELGVKAIDEIYKSIIPEDLLYKEELDLPKRIESEYELKKHVMKLLNKNVSTEEYSSFLGAGCYKHQVPAICDELNSRGEFLTGYCGDTYSDHGKMQAIFEYASMMGELLDADVVTYTSYDGGQAVVSALGTAMRVARARGLVADTLLVPTTINPEVWSQLVEYWRGEAEIIKVKVNPLTGTMDLEDLNILLENHQVAAVLYENPTYLGYFEEQAQEIANLAHKYHAFCAAMAEVTSLGIVESPMNMGADIVCGDIQPLGMHIQFGGGQAGYLACRQEEEWVNQLPTYLYGIAKTQNAGEFGWGRALNSRCSHGSREEANEYFGTETGLWGITAGIYLASMGPQGMVDLGTSIVTNLAYLMDKLGKIPGVIVNPYKAFNFQEVIVNFDHTMKTVEAINKELLNYHIFGGKDLSKDFPELGESALYCVSELTTMEEMLQLVEALTTIVGGAKHGVC